MSSTPPGALHVTGEIPGSPPQGSWRWCGRRNVATRPMTMKPAATSAVVRVASAPAVRSASALVPGSSSESDGIAVPPVSETTVAIRAACAGATPAAFSPDSECAASAAARVAPRDRDPERRADLSRGGLDAGPLARSLGRDVREDHARELRRRETDAEAVDEERRDERARRRCPARRERRRGRARRPRRPRPKRAMGLGRVLLRRSPRRTPPARSAPTAVTASAAPAVERRKA